jgi:hypothetical protein
MIQLVFAFLLVSVHASPFLHKRIAQVTIDAVTPWENACDAAGGGQQCNPIAVSAAATLLAAAGNCGQQNAADKMVDLSKTLGSARMLSLAQIFIQQPRNTPNSVAVPYCDQPPANPELDGLYQCQYIGANLAEFVGGLTLGMPGTIPFNQATVSPPGSCPAHPQGPITAGSQLVSIITNPPNAPSGAPSDSGNSTPAAPSSAGSSPAPTSRTTSAPSNVAIASSATSGFQLANGQAAQKLNAYFATLTPNSACTQGQNACVNNNFAQCIEGKFVLQPCGASSVCVALPLVNSMGTSTTCDTESDALTRISNTGVDGGLTG